MANATGGLILVGAKTNREQSWLEERVSEVDPIPESLLDVQQHLDAIRAWTFPPVAHRVDCNLFRRDSGRGLLAIVVVPAPEDERPIMVRTIAEGGRDVQAFAIARRYGTATEWVSGAQIWADMRDGRAARSNRQLGASAEPPIVERILESIGKLEDLTEATEHAALVYAAFPTTPAGSLPDFFSPDGTLGALRNLPERGLRQAGFGLGYGIDVDSIDGSLAVIEPRRRGLLVGRDGLTIAMAIATDDFLGWGSTRRFGGPSSLDNVESIPLNHYVLAEYTLEFTRFAADVIAANLGATQWKLFVAGRRLKSGSPAAYLARNMDWLSRSAGVPVIDEAAEEFDATGDPEVDAFTLLAEFVHWFGLPTTDVPLATEGRITEQAIRTIGR